MATAAKPFIFEVGTPWSEIEKKISNPRVPESLKDVEHRRNLALIQYNTPGTPPDFKLWSEIEEYNKQLSAYEDAPPEIKFQDKKAPVKKLAKTVAKKTGFIKKDVPAKPGPSKQPQTLPTGSDSLVFDSNGDLVSGHVDYGHVKNTATAPNVTGKQVLNSPPAEKVQVEEEPVTKPNVSEETQKVEEKKVKKERKKKVEKVKEENLKLEEEVETKKKEALVEEKKEVTSKKVKKETKKEEPPPPPIVEKETTETKVIRKRKKLSDEDIPEDFDYDNADSEDPEERKKANFRIRQEVNQRARRREKRLEQERAERAARRKEKAEKKVLDKKARSPEEEMERLHVLALKENKERDSKKASKDKSEADRKEREEKRKAKEAEREANKARSIKEKEEKETERERQRQERKREQGIKEAERQRSRQLRIEAQIERFHYRKVREKLEKRRNRRDKVASGINSIFNDNPVIKMLLKATTGFANMIDGIIGKSAKNAAIVATEKSILNSMGAGAKTGAKGGVLGKLLKGAAVIGGGVLAAEGIEEKGFGGLLKATGGGAMSGAALGAASPIPGGTIIGGLAGGAIGGGIAIAKDEETRKAVGGAISSGVDAVKETVGSGVDFVKDSVTKTPPKREPIKPNNVGDIRRDVFDTKDPDKIRIREKIIKGAKERGLDPNAALAIAYQESRFNPKAHSERDAKGVMQVTDVAAKQVGVDPKKLWDEDTNIRAGLDYAKYVKEKFQKDNKRDPNTSEWARAYNGPPNANFIRSWKNQKFKRENEQYGANVSYYSDVLASMSQKKANPFPVPDNIDKETSGLSLNDIQKMREKANKDVSSNNQPVIVAPQNTTIQSGTTVAGGRTDARPTETTFIWATRKAWAV